MIHPQTLIRESYEVYPFMVANETLAKDTRVVRGLLVDWDQ